MHTETRDEKTEVQFTTSRVTSATEIKKTEAKRDRKRNATEEYNSTREREKARKSRVGKTQKGKFFSRKVLSILSS